MAKAFDPTEHTVDEVNDHLADADEKERARVLAAEEAEDGKGRVTILNGPYGYAEDDERDPFVRGAADLADDVKSFVDETRERLEELVEAHAASTAEHLGVVGHQAVAYQLGRVGSTLPDLARALDAAASTASSLGAEVATVSTDA